MVVPTCIPKDKLIKITPMKHLSYFILSFMLLIIGGCSDSGNPVTTEPPAVDDCGVTDGDNSSCVNYSTEIQPIFDANCTGCHGGAGGLVLDSYSNLWQMM